MQLKSLAVTQLVQDISMGLGMISLQRRCLVLSLNEAIRLRLYVLFLIKIDLLVLFL